MLQLLLSSNTDISIRFLSDIEDIYDIFKDKTRIITKNVDDFKAEIEQFIRELLLCKSNDYKIKKNMAIHITMHFKILHQKKL